MSMRGLCVMLFAAGALVAHARTAAADCAVELEGDPAITAPIRIELGGYGDASASCVAVHVVCRGDGTGAQSGVQGGVEIELRDELGRTSQRWFISPAGAAAFIVSWSQRPVAGGAPGMSIAAGPGATAPTPAPAPETRDLPWHPEIDVGYVSSSDVISGWALAGASLIRQSGIWRYGGTLRGIANVRSRTYLAIEGLAVFGVTGSIMPRWSLGLDLQAGGTVAQPGDQAEGDYGAKGPRLALRASLGRKLRPSIELQLALGFDVMRRTVLEFTSDNAMIANAGTVGFAHVDVAMRWLP